MTTTHDKIRTLYECVQKRPRPEDVAELIMDVLGNTMTPEVRRALGVPASRSMKRLGWNYSSMASDFHRATTKVADQAGVAATLFNVTPLTAIEALDPNKIEALIRQVSPMIHKEFGSVTRHNKQQRHAAGLFKCQRWYNKRFRLILRMEAKLKKFAWESRKYLFTRVGKSALTTTIPFEDFAADVPTACVIAYYSARMSLRSVFTNQSQTRGFDEVTQALLDFAKEQGGIRWDVLAYAMPDAEVLVNLTEEQKGLMIGAWWKLLVDMADMLHEVYLTAKFDPSKMIVSRGSDSSTWNQVAGGWNKARTNWVSLLHVMGMDDMLDEICLGKVMRLMAADVARWHLASGGDIHPDTKVFGVLPFPWDVMHGRAHCTRADVEAACRQFNVDPKGWTGAVKEREAVAFSPTPELVHGVAVSSPELAARLRKAGVFSGKGQKGDIPAVRITRDQHGAAIKVDG